MKKIEDSSKHKTRVLQVVRFYSLENILKYIEEGNIYPKNRHLWGYDKLNDAGYTVNEIVYNSDSIINKIGLIFKIENFHQQIKILLSLNKYDIIYSPWITDTFVIVLLKYLRLIKKPVISISHSTISYNKVNPIKKVFGKLRRHILINGTDRLMYINKQTYFSDLNYGAIPERHGYFETWGVDIDFFKKYSQMQKDEPLNDFVFSTGGTNRDFGILVNAFGELQNKLRVVTKYKSDFLYPLNDNIYVDNTIKPGKDSAEKLLPYYYNANIFAIPLKKKIEMCTGLTVVLEAMAMGKPLITTKNEFYTFDVEEIGVGLNVAYNDVDSWKNSILYLIENPEICKLMGENGLKLSNEKYNYTLFCFELIENIEKIQVKKQK